MVVVENWQDEWQKSSFEHTNIIISYDDDYDYFLHCHHANGEYIIQINKVEATSGEKWPLANPAPKIIKDTVVDLYENIEWYGNNIVKRWLESSVES